MTTHPTSLLRFPFLAITLALALHPATAWSASEIKIEGTLDLAIEGKDIQEECSVPFSIPEGGKGTAYYAVTAKGVSCSPTRLRPAGDALSPTCEITWERKAGDRATVHLECLGGPKPGDSARQESRTFDVRLGDRPSLIPLWSSPSGEEGANKTTQGVWGMVLRLRGRIVSPEGKGFRLELLYERMGPASTGPGRKAAHLEFRADGRGDGSFEIPLAAFPGGDGIRVTPVLRGTIRPSPADDGGLDLDLTVDQVLTWKSAKPIDGSTEGTARTTLQKKLTLAPGETVRLDFPPLSEWKWGPTFHPEWLADAENRLYITAQGEK